MMADADRLLVSLSERLHPLDTPISRLPVAGYRPGHGVWAPRPAAVLVPVLTYERPEILLTVRSRKLLRHPGQVAFPGGRRETSDESVLATALRETSEETGMAGDAVRPAGYLGRYDTITGFRMTAVVGCIDRKPAFRTNPEEVETLFTIPLDWVLDAARYRTEEVEFRGRTFELLTLEHPDHWIWGATAALLDQLRRRLSEQP